MNDGQTRTISTKRGKLTVHPNGQIDGLWQLIKRELRTAAQARKLAGGCTRKTFLIWRRRHGFPEPVTIFEGPGGKLELWSRTEVEAWAAHWSKLTLAQKRAPAKGLEGY